MMLPGYIKEAIGGILCDTFCGENEEFRLVFLNLALSSVSLVIIQPLFWILFQGTRCLISNFVYIAHLFEIEFIFVVV